MFTVGTSRSLILGDSREFCFANIQHKFASEFVRRCTFTRGGGGGGDEYAVTPAFEPVEESLRETVLPSLFGTEISETERRLFQLPVKFSGLGIVTQH